MQNKDKISESKRTLDGVLKESLETIHYLLSLNRMSQFRQPQNTEVEACEKRLGELKANSAVDSITKCIKLAVDAKSVLDDITYLLEHQNDWQAGQDELHPRLPILPPSSQNVTSSKNHNEVSDMTGNTKYNMKYPKETDVPKLIEVGRVNFSAGDGNARTSNGSEAGTGDDSNTGLERLSVETQPIESPEVRTDSS